jgi:hypothetical protein
LQDNDQVRTVDDADGHVYAAVAAAVSRITPSER